MEKKLRILLLEDSAADAELITFELRRIDEECEIKRVDTKDAFSEALKSFDPSLILADYTLPNFDAMSALKIAKLEAPTVPFIIVTGSISEEVAVECMKAGTWDYVLKDHLARLIPAAKGALEKKFALHQTQKAEEETKRAVEDWQRTFDAISDLVFIQDTDYRIKRVNKSFVEALKVNPADLVDKKCFEVLHHTKGPFEGCPCEETLKDKKVHTNEINDPELGMPLQVTTSPIFDDKGEFTGVLHVAKDISQKKETAKLQRLAQIGEFTADIAHEVNNPLQVILGRAQMALDEASDNEELKDNLNIIVNQSQRAKEVVDRLLTFAKPGKGENKEINLNAAINFVVSLLEKQYSLGNVKIHKEFKQDLPFVMGDEKLIQEVLMNLIKNAEEAIPDGGEIAISTFVEEGKIHIDVKDTGAGISEENLLRVFDPFFTTKDKGTGLGLSVCYGIIKAHGGDMRYESKLGEGTTATIILPAGD